MFMKEKKSRGLIGLIIILIIVILGLSAYICYSLFIKNNDECVEKSENKEVVEEKGNEQFSKIAKKMVAENILKTVSIGTCGLGYEYDFTNKDIIEYKDLSEIERINMTYHYLYDFYHYPYELVNSDLALAYEKVFGVKDYKFPNEIHIFSNFTTYELDENEIYKSIAGGGGCMSSSHYAIDDYGVDDDKFFIDVIYYIRDIDPEYDGKAYIANAFNNPDSNPSFRFEINYSDSEESYIGKIKENKDKFIKYRFTFKINNDNYIFDSIKKI